MLPSLLCKFTENSTRPPCSKRICCLPAKSWPLRVAMSAPPTSILTLYGRIVTCGTSRGVSKPTTPTTHMCCGFSVALGSCLTLPAASSVIFRLDSCHCCYQVRQAHQAKACNTPVPNPCPPFEQCNIYLPRAPPAALPAWLCPPPPPCCRSEEEDEASGCDDPGSV